MGHFIFRQLIPSRFHRIFDMIVAIYNGDRYVKDFTCWNLLQVLIFAQLSGCDSLREFICLAQAHCKKGKHLGFGDGILNSTPPSPRIAFLLSQNTSMGWIEVCLTYYVSLVTPSWRRCQ